MVKNSDLSSSHLIYVRAIGAMMAPIASGHKELIITLFVSILQNGHICRESWSPNHAALFILSFSPILIWVMAIAAKAILSLATFSSFSRIPLERSMNWWEIKSFQHVLALIRYLHPAWHARNTSPGGRTNPKLVSHRSSRQIRSLWEQRDLPVLSEHLPQTERLPCPAPWHGPRRLWNME